jgi:DNA-binding MarR family transcriptional regulator
MTNMMNMTNMTKKPNRVKIPPSVAEQAMVRLMRVGDSVWRASDERFGRWGMTDNHYNVLRILNGLGEPISQAEIGRRMLSSRANVTKLIDLLEERKMVRRLPSQDRRVNLVALTDEGARFIEETLSEIIAFANEALAALTRDEQKLLFNLLGKLLNKEE